MTGYTVHTGASEKFVEGWDQIFQQKKSAKPVAKPAAAQQTPKSSKNSKKNSGS